MQENEQNTPVQAPFSLLDAGVRARYGARAEVLKALGHPTRLFLVDELARRERCVAELAELVGADISTVSRHLTLLKQAGILRDERRGACTYYRLKMPCVLSFFVCIEDALAAGAQERLDLAQKRE
jgi:ArsR family transcriptional regulator